MLSASAHFKLLPYQFISQALALNLPSTPGSSSAQDGSFLRNPWVRMVRDLQLSNYSSSVHFVSHWCRFSEAMMSTGEDHSVFVTMHIRNLSGSSRPLLVQGSDGNTYVLKHYCKSQASNRAFNEAAGTEIYRTFGLSVPSWRPLFLPDELIDTTPEFWHQGERPTGGMCFGSRFLPQAGRLCYEIFPSSFRTRIRNRNSFWLAWLIDLCCHHTANRQIVFQEQPAGVFEAYFIDHDHLFGGTLRENDADLAVCRYINPALYPELSPELFLEIGQLVLSTDMNLVWHRALALPHSWMTGSVLELFSESLERLSTSKNIENLLTEMATMNGMSCCAKASSHRLAGTIRTEHLALASAGEC
jgi:hypothetical protein